MCSKVSLKNRIINKIITMSFFMSSNTTEETTVTNDNTLDDLCVASSVYFPEKGEIDGSDPLWVLSVDGTPLSYSKTYSECKKMMVEYAEYLSFNCSQSTRTRLEYSHNAIHIIGTNSFSILSYYKTMYYLTISEVLHCPEFY